jgi:NADH:ubiquinone oxidoreductase subunit C
MPKPNVNDMIFFKSVLTGQMNDIRNEIIRRIEPEANKKIYDALSNMSEEYAEMMKDILAMEVNARKQNDFDVIKNISETKHILKNKRMIIDTMKAEYKNYVKESVV